MQNLLRTSSNIFDVVTLLNQSPQDNDLFYLGKIQEALMRYISSEEIEKRDLFNDFIQKISLIQISFKGENSCFFKISLLSKKIENPAKFFYEMIDRWLLPSKKPYICSFFSCDFLFSYTRLHSN